MQIYEASLVQDDPTSDQLSYLDEAIAQYDHTVVDPAGHQQQHRFRSARAKPEADLGGGAGVPQGQGHVAVAVERGCKER